MAVKNKKKDLHRKITHQTYKYKNKMGDKGPQSWLPKVILDHENEEYYRAIGSPCVTDEFMQTSACQNVTPTIGG